MVYVRLFLSNKRLLTFGIMLTFFAGFGKTFLISLYIPDILQSFDLGITTFSGLYALATLAGGVFIIYLGKLIDDIKLRRYAIWVTFGLALSTILVALTHNIFFLLVGLFGLRLTGQGLMNHTSMTVMSKYFKRCRGKAISISIIGHAMSESILPIITATCIALYGWRDTMAFSAILMVIIIVPLIFSLLESKPKADEKGIVHHKNKKHKKIKSEWTVSKLLKDDTFYLLAPHTFTMPFIFTGLMFFMIPLATYKGWSIEWMAFCFTGFAIANFSASILSGYVIDRMKAIKIFPYFLIPMALGISLILLFSGDWVALAYLILTGISMGMAVTTESAVVTEVYGLRNIGTVRSVFTFISIIGSALGPFAISLLLDSGFALSQILEFCLIIIAGISINSFRKFPKKHHAISTIWEIPRVMIYRKAS
jgi:MFS family permease